MVTCKELVDLLRQAKQALEEMAPTMPPDFFGSKAGKQAYFAGWSEAIGMLRDIVGSAEHAGAAGAEGSAGMPTPRELLAQLRRAQPPAQRWPEEEKQLYLIGWSDALLDLDSIIDRAEHPEAAEQAMGTGTTSTTLTCELDKPASPVRKFLDACFAVPLGQVRRSLPADVRQRLSTVVLPPPASLRGGALGTVGTAFDYRVRFYFTAPAARTLTAGRGASLLWGLEREEELADGTLVTREPSPRSGHFGPSPAVVGGFFAEVDHFVRTCSPQRRRLTGSEEKTLARYCLILALFEEVYRAFGSPYFDSPLFHLGKDASVADLVALASADQVADLCALWNGLLAEVDLGYESVIYNPVLGFGSLAADADLILDDCLLELKTSQRPNLAQYLRQLLGYVLLDTGDRYGIRRVGVYLARQRCLATFSLHDLLIGSTSDRKEGRIRLEERLAQLRADFRAVVEALPVR